MSTATTMATPISRNTQIIRHLPALGLAAVLVACLAGCGITPPTPPTPSAEPRFVQAAWTELPGWHADRVHEAWPALIVGCGALSKRPAATTWREFCAAAAGVDAGNEAAVRGFLEANLAPWRVTSKDTGQDQGLVTGYYEPRLAGARAPDATFRVPLHARPDDLLVLDLADVYPELKGKRVRGRMQGKRVVPYWSRAEIEAGKAAPGPGAIAWVADPLDAFFLEVQGSGRIDLPDGSVMRLGYADQNGHPYKAIGRVLVDRGEMTLEESSMQSIRAWAAKNPARLRELLDQNPSYVFFREVPAAAPGSIEAAINGPIGSLGVPLLARRAIAVDPRAIPLGAPVWIATTLPAGGQPLQRLVLAQDTGGAIRGAVRADFFFGSDADAAELAGRMRQQGSLWLLWPKGAPPPGGG